MGASEPPPADAPAPAGPRIRRGKAAAGDAVTFTVKNEGSGSLVVDMVVMREIESN
jgi:hypothetical protein